MISCTPKHLSSLDANGVKTDSVIEDVNPETDAVNVSDVVTDALVVGRNEPLSVDEDTDEENDEERDWDSAVLISAPKNVPTYWPLHAGSSVNDAVRTTFP